MQAKVLIKQCPWCHGTGHFPAPGNKCSACNGTGRVKT